LPSSAINSATFAVAGAVRTIAACVSVVLTLGPPLLAYNTMLSDPTGLSDRRT
jgi:hypothetical protein